MASAMIYSVIETAKENGLKPLDYLCYVLRTAPKLNLHIHEQFDFLIPQSFVTTVGALSSHGGFLGWGI